MNDHRLALTLSVHELIDFVYRTGHIDNRVFNSETMNKGSQMHAFYQAKQNDTYRAEVFFTHVFPYENKDVTVQGRADGLIINGDVVTIEEIKTTNSPLALFFRDNETWHLSQAKVYALIYALAHKKEEMRIMLTYISQVNDEKDVYHYVFSKEELIAFMADTFRAYFSFFAHLDNHHEIRALSAKSLTFPYTNLRSGQVELMATISDHLSRVDRLFINAPTGSGKTIATLYPSLKMFATNEQLRIFYLTAKTSGQHQAQATMELLNRQGLVSKTIILSSKEKMCVNEKISCNPDECPFARNYFGKVKDALLDIFPRFQIFTPELVKEYAKKHEICPFEFQLDLSLMMDVIIGDYNYLFDPFVYLRRFFENKHGEYIALVDEAHNLGRRIMDNFSFTLDFNLLFPLRKLLKGTQHKLGRLAINRVAKHVQAFTDLMSEEYENIPTLNEPLYNALAKLLVDGSAYMQEVGPFVSEAFKDFYFAVNKFLKLYAFFSADFKLYAYRELEKGSFPTFNLRCFNPTPFLFTFLAPIDHAFFFSATLAPLPYYTRLLGASDFEVKQIASPFASENLLVLVDKTVSLFYKDRDQTISEVAAKIKTAINYRVGNYIVYAPSFAYLERLLPYFTSEEELDVIIQKKMMNDEEKNDFLEAFTLQPTKRMVGFAVIGGSFSEGVDLVSDRLSGVIILGVGFPALTYDKDLEKAYYDTVLADGFLYAYVYPGLNKVLQTMGRVIRSENDRGFILLFDKRYGHEPYRSIINEYHGHVHLVKTKADIGQKLTAFYELFSA